MTGILAGVAILALWLLAGCLTAAMYARTMNRLDQKDREHIAGP